MYVSLWLVCVCLKDDMHFSVCAQTKRQMRIHFGSPELLCVRAYISIHTQYIYIFIDIDIDLSTQTKRQTHPPPHPQLLNHKGCELL
jgi:hypothetical protein